MIVPVYNLPSTSRPASSLYLSCIFPLPVESSSLLLRVVVLCTCVLMQGYPTTSQPWSAMVLASLGFLGLLAICSQFLRLTENIIIVPPNSVKANHWYFLFSGDRFRLFLLRAPASVHLHSEPVLQVPVHTPMHMHNLNFLYIHIFIFLFLPLFLEHQRWFSAPNTGCPLTCGPWVSCVYYVPLCRVFLYVHFFKPGFYGIFQ